MRELEKKMAALMTNHGPSLRCVRLVDFGPDEFLDTQWRSWQYDLWVNWIEDWEYQRVRFEFGNGGLVKDQVDLRLYMSGKYVSDHEGEEEEEEEG
jgi:hypothetical protein